MKLIVISVSIQPILSLAVRYNLTPNDCAAKLVEYFKILGADIVLDMSIADELALLESRKEFVKRFKKPQTDGNSHCIPMLASSCPGKEYFKSFYYFILKNTFKNLGWVCYAEKTHGTYVLPYIATTKSPQQIMGSLVKQCLKSYAGNKQIYHVTVMPCYDKKLEASRPDFVDEQTQTREVDCVITSSKF